MSSEDQECPVCEGNSEELYNPDCDVCARVALSEWVDHLNSFIDSGFPKSYQCDEAGVSWLDLMDYESHRCSPPDAWDTVSGQWHGSMFCPVYKVESSWRAGYTVTRELLVEYRDELATNL